MNDPTNRHMKNIIAVAIVFLMHGQVKAEEPKKREFVPIVPTNHEELAKEPVVWYGPDGEVLPVSDPDYDGPEATLFPMVKLDFD